MDKKQKHESRLMSERRTYRIEGITPLLGSQAANPDIRTAHIMSKAPKDLTDDENEYLPNPDDQDLNVFLRDPKTGALMLMDYMVRGFFKAAIDATKSQTGSRLPLARWTNTCLCIRGISTSCGTASPSSRRTSYSSGRSACRRCRGRGQRSRAARR